MISAQLINLIFLTNLLFLILILISPRASSSSSSSQPNSAKQIKTVHHRSMTSTIMGSTPSLRYQVFHIKNTTPYNLDGHVARPPRGRASKRSKRAAMRVRDMRRKKTATRPNFSVMLPKGFVPPSGSSPCHNGVPNSVVFFCANAKP